MEAAPVMDARHESCSAANSDSTLKPPQHDDEEQLPQRIQALAQELQDMILDHTLIAGLENSKDKSPTNKIILRSRYRFPWQLHLNRRTRKLVAQHYFAHSVFQVRDAHCRVMPPSTLEAWLISVDPLYISLLKTIRLDFREAKETCLYNLLVAVEDVDEYRESVKESCGYELEESIFLILVERNCKKRVGQKRYMRKYTVEKAREIGDSPYSQYAHLDRPIQRGD